MASELESEDRVAAAQEDSRIKTVTRRQLYDLVWKTPPRKLAEQFGLTEFGLAKTCQRNRIPRPPAGYWAKVRQGKSVRKSMFRPDEQLDRLAIVFDMRPTSEGLKGVSLVERPPDIAAANKRVLRILPVHIPDELERPHRFVALTGRAMRRSLRSGRGKQGDLVHLIRDLDGPRLRISVMEASIPRALRLANAILRTAIAAGFKVASVKDEGCEHVSLTVIDEPFTFSITERRKRVPHLLTAEEKELQEKYGYVWQPDFDYQGSDELTLTVWPIANKYRTTSWKDGKLRRLEEKIGQVLLSLPVQLQELRESIERVRLAEIKRCEEERQRKEEERRRREERQRVEVLLKNAQEWHTAENVREYASVMATALQQIAPDGDTNVQEWLAWANAVADRLDPICQIREQNGSAGPNRPR